MSAFILVFSQGGRLISNSLEINFRPLIRLIFSVPADDFLDKVILLYPYRGLNLQLFSPGIPSDDAVEVKVLQSLQGGKVVAQYIIIQGEERIVPVHA